MFGDLREEFADFDSAFAVSLKSERRSERGAAQAFVLAQFFFAGKRLSMKLIEFWLEEFTSAINETESKMREIA